MASAEGIVKSKDPTLLKEKVENSENGSFGGIELGKGWAMVC